LPAAKRVLWRAEPPADPSRCRGSGCDPRLSAGAQALSPATDPR
jgi:hypothetical protein